MRKRGCLLALVWLLPLMALAHHVTLEDGFYKMSHEWHYDDVKWSCHLSVPANLYEYYQERTHLGDEFVHYVLSDYDREIIRQLVSSFRAGGEKWGLTEVGNVYNVITFVQSLKYVHDSDSKGEEDYVRFPLETLVDGVGDCEDMVILAASILYEMGYGVVLVSLPDHLALAVKSEEDFPGTYYDYEGSKYYYLEMTNTGWDIGQVPQQFRGVPATLIPVVYQHHLRIEEWLYRYDSYFLTDLTVPVTLELTVMNVGPGVPEELQLHAMVRPDATSDWVLFERRFGLPPMDEGARATFRVEMPVPRPIKGVLELRLEGLGFESSSVFVEGLSIQ